MPNFPLSRDDFQDTLKLSVSGLTPFRLERYEISSGLGTGQEMISEVAPPRWIGEFALANMTPQRAAGVLALLDALGTRNTVYLYDPTTPYPAHDPDGSLTNTTSNKAVSGIGSDNASMRISGLPGSYQLTRGDMISVTYSGRRALFRIASNASGNGYFDVTPHIPVGVTNGSSVTIARPTGMFRITGFSPGAVDGRYVVSGMRFSVRQALP